MRLLLALVLALVTAACAASSRAPTPGADVWGNFETGIYGDVDDIRVIHIAPPEGGAPDPDIEGIIRTSLERRGYTLDTDAPLVLRYMIHTALTDSGDRDFGIVLGGSAGSSSSVNDFGVGLELPIFSGGNSVRQVAFLFELALEGLDRALLWRGRASGRAYFSNPQRIARPVAPLLIDRLGRETLPRSFAR